MAIMGMRGKNEEDVRMSAQSNALMFLPQHIREMMQKSTLTIVVDNCLSHDIGRRKRVERTRSASLPREPRRGTSRSKSDTLLHGVSRWTNETYPDKARMSRPTRDPATKNSRRKPRKTLLDDAAPKPPRRSNSFRKLMVQLEGSTVE